MSTPLKILVAGRSGQLAQALQKCADADPRLELRALGRPDLDIADPQACRSAVETFKPDMIINAAAFANVDAATTCPDMAVAVNALGPGHLASAAAAARKPVVHISTDYVFDGKKETAYIESDTTCPINTYGETKLAGEDAVVRENPQHLILRTAWLYSAHEPNFVSRILSAAAGDQPLAMVTDQIGNPTSAADLARVLLLLARHMTDSDWNRLSGVYHLAGPEAMSRHAWASAVLGASRACGGPHRSVAEAVSEDFPTPARRPLRTSLDSSRFSAAFGIHLPPAEQSVAEAVRSLLHAKESLV